MDKLKLAQFEKLSSSSKNLGCEFLKRFNNDLNYSIPETSYEDSSQIGYTPGYSYLHIAAKNFDLASINELIKRKVDLVMQGHKDRKTPLHIVSSCFKRKRSKSFRPNDSVMAYAGKLKENKCVDVLLSAQVETGITANPKSADGTSHLHIACIYNHVKAVQLFLSVGESVDHATDDKHEWPGYTALHFAIRYSAFEAAEILLDHGADIHLKDLGDKSALDWIIVRLMDIADFLAIGKRTYCPFYEQERDILESILEMFLKRREVEDISGDSGTTLLHILCILKNSTVIKNFFKQNMDINGATKSDSKLWPGWTPLHFAACFNVETFKFLLQNGADLTIKNAKEETPLDFCMERYTPNIIHSILSMKQEYRDILFSDGLTKFLDIVLLMTNDDMFKKWMEHLVNVDISIPLNSPIWPGCNLLHLAVLNERKKLKDANMIFEADIAMTEPGIDEGLMDYWNKIMYCLLSKPYNFNSNNAAGLSPFYLAFHLRKIDSVEMILDSRQVNDDNTNGLTYFHIASAIGNIKVIKRFVNKLVAWNSPTKFDFQWYENSLSFELTHVCANSTPMHIAVIFESIEVVRYLLKIGVRIHLKDQRGLEPLHLALINHESAISSKIARDIVGRMMELGETLTEDNLHCLHVAAISDDADAIAVLLQKGASSEIRFEPSNSELRSKFAKDLGKTPLHLAITHRNLDAFKALIKGGANIFATFGENSEKMLDSAIRFRYHADDDFISALEQMMSYVIEPIDESGLTMLHIACQKFDDKWIKSLLEKGADPNARIVLKDNIQGGATPLDIIAHRVFDDRDDMDNESFELLIEFGADVTIMNCQGRTPLHVLYYEAHKRSTNVSADAYNVLPTMDLLLETQTNHNVNPTDFYGLSHFHLACFRNNLEAVKKFLNAGVDVNQACDPFAEIKGHAGYTPLHFALNQKNGDLARLLIENGANVKAEDIRGDTPLHIALEQGFVNVQLIGLMLRHGVDINAENAEGTTPIEYLFMREAFTLQQLQIMLNHGAAIYLTSVKPHGSGILGLALKNAEHNDRQSIFNRIMNVCDVKSVIKRGFNVIDSAVNVEQKGQLTVAFYVDVIEQLIDAGCDINQEDRQGKTALHRATSLFNYEAVKALLLSGADLNVVDKNGESPITHEVINKYDSKVVSGTRTLYHLVCEIWKMRNIGLNVNESTKTAAFQMFDRFASLDTHLTLESLRTMCLDEFYMKVWHTSINQLTLDKFLSEKKAVIWYSRMPLAERQLIDAYFKCGDNIRQEFREWGGFLIMQYRKAVARAKMIKPAMKIIFSAGIKLPDLCLEQIVEYLNYDELKLFVREY